MKVREINTFRCNTTDQNHRIKNCRTNTMNQPWKCVRSTLLDAIPRKKTIGSKNVELIPWANHESAWTFLFMKGTFLCMKVRELFSIWKKLFSAWKCVNFSLHERTFSLHESAWTFLYMKETFIFLKVSELFSTWKKLLSSWKCVKFSLHERNFYLHESVWTLLHYNLSSEISGLPSSTTYVS